jgi:hypothetical protein
MTLNSIILTCLPLRAGLDSSKCLLRWYPFFHDLKPDSWSSAFSKFQGSWTKCDVMRYSLLIGSSHKGSWTTVMSWESCSWLDPLASSSCNTKHELKTEAQKLHCIYLTLKNDLWGKQHHTHEKGNRELIWEVITLNSKQTMETNFLFSLYMDEASEDISCQHTHSIWWLVCLRMIFSILNHILMWMLRTALFMGVK